MGNSKEAKARIKINKLLEESGWRFFDNEKGQTNIQLEPNVKIIRGCAKNATGGSLENKIYEYRKK